MADTSICATLTFLKRTNVYEDEKPYSIDPDVKSWTAPIPRSNFQGERIENIAIHDLRRKETSFSFERNGFAIVELQSRMTYEDFQSPSKVEDVYSHEVASCLLHYFEAASVQVFDVLIRRRHPSFPYVEPKPNLPVQPAERVHIDGSQRSLLGLVEELHRNDMPKYKRCTYVNVWKPLKGPLYDWPLAVCDPGSIDPSLDLDYHDHVFADVTRENIMVHHNKNQKWYYLSAHEPNELLLFKQADLEGNTGVAHTAFEIPRNSQSVPPDSPRESIEARVIVYFND